MKGHGVNCIDFVANEGEYGLEIFGGLRPPGRPWEHYGSTPMAFLRFFGAETGMDRLKRSLV